LAVLVLSRQQQGGCTAVFGLHKIPCHRSLSCTSLQGGRRASRANLPPPLFSHSQLVCAQADSAGGRAHRLDMSSSEYRLLSSARVNKHGEAKTEIAGYSRRVVPRHQVEHSPLRACKSWDRGRINKCYRNLIAPRKGTGYPTIPGIVPWTPGLLPVCASGL
jgi:hypothetical protein